MKLSGFFKCAGCDKVHSIGGITRTSVCKCGMNLWHYLLTGEIGF